MANTIRANCTRSSCVSRTGIHREVRGRLLRARRGLWRWPDSLARGARVARAMFGLEPARGHYYGWWPRRPHPAPRAIRHGDPSSAEVPAGGSFPRGAPTTSRSRGSRPFHGGRGCASVVARGGGNSSTGCGCAPQSRRRGGHAVGRQPAEDRAGAGLPPARACHSR
jgi:hypothetical protein